MSDTYQAVFDAVRSRIHNADIGDAVERAMRDCNLSHYVEQASRAWQEAAWEQQRPCVVFKPKLYPDGDHWCALLGKDLMVGVSGFGKSPAEAMYGFDNAWNQTLPGRDK